MPDALRRVRRWTVFFMTGLVLSGLTAIPIRGQLDVAIRTFGEDLGTGALPSGVARWLLTLRDGIRATSDGAPFLFYGTDWLAFGHFAIAFAFVGALRDPLRNRWLYRYGMAICAAVPVWAFVFGPIRGIPFWWQLVDASFGVVGFVPMWRCDRWIARVEREGAEGGRSS
jgi:hypothetical protein